MTAPQSAAKAIVDRIMQSFSRVQKRLMKRSDHLYREFSETELAIETGMTSIVMEAIDGSPRREHLGRARAALATASQYIRGYISDPECVSPAAVNAMLDSVTSVPGARIPTKFDVFGPTMTRGELADVLLAAAGVLFGGAVGNGIELVTGSPPAGPVRPEVEARYGEMLKQFAQLIATQKMDPRSISLGTALVAELQPLQVVAEFVQLRVDVVRDAAHPLANSTSHDVSVARRGAARASRSVRSFIADEANFWEPSEHCPDQEDAIADAVTDLCHLAKSLRLDVEELLERGKSRFCGESFDGPDVFPTSLSARRTEP